MSWILLVDNKNSEFIASLIQIILRDKSDFKIILKD